MEQITSMYSNDWLLKDPEVNHCINACINDKGAIDYNEFYYHWDNFEMTYQYHWKPTKKQIDKMVALVTKTDLPEKYHGAWWPKIKAAMEEGASNPKIWGQQVDRYTASMIYNVVTKLNEANQTKIKAMDFPVAHHVVMSFYSDKRKGLV